MTDHRGAGPVAIVGASLAGLRTAESLRRAGYGGAITVFGEERHMPYHRPALSKEVLTSSIGGDDVVLARRAAVYDVDWRLARPVVSVDLDRRELTDATGETHPYRVLVVATGMRAARLALSDAPGEGRLTLRTIDDALRLRSALCAGTRLVVVGAGFIGCEVASAARGLGCDVTVVDTTSMPMQRPLGTMLAAELMRRHEERGVRFHMESGVVGIEGRTRPTAVLLRSGVRIPADVVLEAVGTVPNVEWLAGNDIDVTRGVRTDLGMRALRTDGTPWPDVFAVGDVARFPFLGYGEELMVGHWNIPVETARRAVEVLVEALATGSEPVRSLGRSFAPIPMFWSDQFDAHLLTFGVPELADSATLLEGSAGGTCVVGYHRAGRMVGVCGLGMRSAVLRHRVNLGCPATTARAAAGTAVTRAM